MVAPAASRMTSRRPYLAVRVTAPLLTFWSGICETGVTADDGGQLEPRIGGDGRRVLVVGDLAQANESEADRGHSAFTVTGWSTAWASGLLTG